jgi:hypothetical protein
LLEMVIIELRIMQPKSQSTVQSMFHSTVHSRVQSPALGVGSGHETRPYVGVATAMLGGARCKMVVQCTRQ